MSLLLTVYSTPAWKTFANVLGLSRIDAPPTLIDSPVLLEPMQSLSILPALISEGHHLWVAAEQAEHFLANAIESGDTLEIAAKQWQAQTNALLALQCKHRRNLQIFNIQQALAQPASFRELLGSAMSIANYPPQPTNNSLALLAACQYVAQEPELRVLNTRLQASALPLSENETLRPDINTILQHQAAITTQLTTTTNERDLILLHLQQVQEQLENDEQTRAVQLATVIQERDLALEQLNNMQPHVEHLNAELGRLQLALQAEEQKDKHTTLARDKQHAKEITKLEAELSKTKARASSTEYANELLKQELTKLRESTLWKATSPVRKLGSLIKNTNKVNEKLLQDTALLLTSEYFDINWYLQNYPDIIESNMNPAEHYLLYGAAEGRLPGPLFDGNWYMQHYPDVSSAGVNPLLHFIMFGQQEGRSSSPKLLTNNSQNAEE